MAAARYAIAWYKVTDADAATTRNKVYNYYGGFGGDCTNFVSQSLKAGGMKFMRSQGRNDPWSPYGGANRLPFLKGEGSWWSRWWTPSIGPPRQYEPTASFVRADTLYHHLLDYNLAGIVVGYKHAKPGDVVFYHHGGAMTHSQIVARAKPKIMIAQHSESAYKPIIESFKSMTDNYGARGSGWNIVILRPLFSVSDIPA